jgi:hypothetical protein
MDITRPFRLWITMTNIQKFRLLKIVDFVPEVKICTRQISFRCAEEINRVLIPENPTLLTPKKSLNPL